MKYVENISTGKLVRVPRRAKKSAKKNGLVITGKVGKVWLATSQEWLDEVEEL